MSIDIKKDEEQKNDQMKPTDEEYKPSVRKETKNKNNINISKDNKRTSGDGEETEQLLKEKIKDLLDIQTSTIKKLGLLLAQLLEILTKQDNKPHKVLNENLPLLGYDLRRDDVPKAKVDESIRDKDERIQRIRPTAPSAEHDIQLIDTRETTDTCIRTEASALSLSAKVEKRLDGIERSLKSLRYDNKVCDLNLLKLVSDWRRNDFEGREKLREEFSRTVQDALQKLELKVTQHESVTYTSDFRGDKSSGPRGICLATDCPCPCLHKVDISAPCRKREKAPKRAKKNVAMTAGGDGDGGYDGGSSDGSSSENDKGKHRPIPRFNADSWRDAILRKDEERIASLIYMGKVPCYAHLMLVFEIFGRKSNVMKTICDQVCGCISRQITNIITVIPSYELDDFEMPKDIVFVVYIKTHSQNDICFKDFHLETRVMNQYSSEGMDIARMEDRDNLTFSEDELERIERNTTKFTEELFRQHSNLQMISPSHFRSSMYEKDNPNIEKNVCIALYVPVKGYIPLAEEVFPKFLDGVPTDVREGGFEFFSKANEWHKNIKMGCGVCGNFKKTGTIGPFIEENGHLYFLTSAHVVFNPNEISPDCAYHEWDTKESVGGPSMDVYQPEPKKYSVLGSDWEKPVGKICLAFYKKGDDRTPGMEVAVVKIIDTDRKPLSGDFPDSDDPMQTSEDNADQESDQRLVYETGAIVEYEFIVNNRERPFDIIKFGAESGKTTSRVNDFHSSVGGKLCDNDGKIALYNQIMISENHGGVEFGEPGDSGALILANIDGQMRALGLLVGRGSTGRVLATPMYAILDELSAKYQLTSRTLMAFPRQPTSQISTDSGVSTDSLPEALDSIHQEISQEVAQHSKELGDNLRKEMTTEISVLKNEIGVMNSEIEVVKSDVNNLKHTVSNIDTKVTDLSNNIDSKVTDLSNNIDTKVTYLSSNIDSKVTDLSSTIDSKVSDLSSNIDSKVADLSSTFDSKVSDLSSNIDSKVADLSSTIDSKVTDLSSNMMSMFEQILQKMDKDKKD